MEAAAERSSSRKSWDGLSPAAVGESPSLFCTACEDCPQRLGELLGLGGQVEFVEEAFARHVAMTFFAAGAVRGRALKAV